MAGFHEALDKITTLEIENEAKELVLEKQELLENQKALAAFIENHLITPFIDAMNSVDSLTRGGKSKLWQQELQSVFV